MLKQILITLALLLGSTSQLSASKYFCYDSGTSNNGDYFFCNLSDDNKSISSGSNSNTKLFSNLKDSNVTVDKESGTTTIIADSNVSTEIGFVYRAIVVIDKNGKAKSKILRVNLVIFEETIIDFTLKNSLSYKEGNNIKISIKNAMLEIKIRTKINTPLIIN